MANPNGNPNISKYAMRYGEGQDASAAGKKGGTARASIRAQVRLWASREVDYRRLGDDDYLNDLLTEGGRRPMPTLAEVIAFKKVLLAINDKQMMESVTNDVDGKLVERKVETQAKTLADLIAMSQEIERAEEEGSHTIDGTAESVDEPTPEG